MLLSKGYIQVYTGNGKGKTTAALGLSLRAICAGKKVYFGQFAKGMDYSELKVPEMLPNFTMEQFGRDAFIKGKPTDEDREKAHKGLNKIENILTSNEYDIVVLDELNIATYYKLISVDEILEILHKRNPEIEVIITGRYADPKIIEIADLVTEMKLVKHYYNNGVKARVGIEN
ncbi:cob(I)yrinic acid a,c-diamide adenosyltransferase [Clostridium sp. cel8]|uniref:cob(I)yrinic acid a,c-diamide adenosyltransferase n=1 Tax=Clostridium sp. cel8 TaxID=2663123 RepID=UPI0015F486C8|nr:cob(I)yrinic acid a,c-diamide adenosyltransferase [Clostridium sp. cel8]